MNVHSIEKRKDRGPPKPIPPAPPRPTGCTKSSNKVNQLDPFFVRAAHEKGSSYLRR
jgi:hypothetical protein